MSPSSAAWVFAGALLLLWGCGGEAVVTAESGVGGSTPSSTVGSGGDGGAGFTCTLMCGGPAGLCGCTGPCSDGKVRAIGCGVTGTGATCTCSVDEQVVGQCDEPSLLCALPESCCGAVFGG